MLGVSRARVFHHEKEVGDGSMTADVEVCPDRVTLAASIKGVTLDASDKTFNPGERIIAPDFAWGSEEKARRGRLGWTAEPYGHGRSRTNDNDLAGWTAESHGHGRFRNDNDLAGSADSHGHVQPREDNGNGSCAAGLSDVAGSPLVCEESRGVLGQRGMLSPRQPPEFREGDTGGVASRAVREVMARPTDFAAFK